MELDLTTLVNLNKHSAAWSKRADEFGLYTIHTVTPTKLRIDPPWNKTKLLNVSIKEGNQLNTAYWCEEARILLQHAIDNNLKVKMYACYQHKTGKYKLALADERMKP